jgi:hypothetical protein
VTKRRTAVFILAAGRGDVRAARGLVANALRTVLGVRGFHQEPYHVSYMSAAEVRREGMGYGGDYQPRYYADLTEDEFARVMNAVHTAAMDGGWSDMPIDAYHD